MSEVSSEEQLPHTAPQACAVTARDGYELAATHYRYPDAVPARGVILFSSAMAVAQSFYGACARHFAAAGYHCYTYDYRGIGESAPDSLRGFDTSVVTWAQHDIPAMIDFVRDRHPDGPLIYFAHSVGGQLLGMVDNADRVDRAVMISSQLGYWGVQGGVQKYAVWMHGHLVLPTVTRLVGYFPWSRFGNGLDLPKGVALQWASWCRRPRYLFDDPTLGDLVGYRSLDIPILVYLVSDDDWGTEAAVRGMVEHYTGAAIEYRHLDPNNHGYDSLGHFGFFKRGRQQLWEDARAWIEQKETA